MLRNISRHDGDENQHAPNLVRDDPVQFVAESFAVRPLSVVTAC